MRLDSGERAEIYNLYMGYATLLIIVIIVVYYDRSRCYAIYDARLDDDESKKNYDATITK
jgi:hypothetical protein